MEGLTGGAARRSDRLSTSGVARASGCSVQQVRDLEALGVIAPADRAGNGYRWFGAVHVRDVAAYRDLAAAVGPVRARRTMRDVRTVPTAEAAAMVSALHVGLAGERDEALAARRALEAIRAEAGADAQPAEDDTMTITQLAGALGVRASTLRFWEGAGLVTPVRVTARAGSARRYPLPAIREARITAALRAAGYRIPEVQQALTALREVRDVDQSLEALDRRVDTLAARMLALLRAGAVLAAIIGTVPPTA